MNLYDINLKMNKSYHLKTNLISIIKHINKFKTIE